MRVYLSIILLYLLVCTAHGSAIPLQSTGEVKAAPVPEDILEHFVSIIPNVERIDLRPAKEVRGGALGILSSAATIVVRISSNIPMWEAVVEIGTLTGAAGDLPRDRSWVKTEGTGDAFVPFMEPVKVMSEDGPVPARDTSIELEIRPDWNDVPGEYSGMLTFMPMIREAGVPFLMAQSNETPLQKRMRPPKVEIHLCIPEVIVLSLSSTELKFSGVGGPGIYKADNKVRFKVFTNSLNWAVICDATELKSDNWLIPAEQIHWERVRRDGRVEEQGTLAGSPCVVRGRGRLPEDEIVISFSIEVTMDDKAGNYNGGITLKGIVEQ